MSTPEVRPTDSQVRNTMWSKMVSELDEPVIKPVSEFVSENKVLTGIGGTIGAVASVALLIKNKFLANHILPINATVASAAATTFLADESVQDMKDGNYGVGLGKAGAAALTGSATLDIGTFYLNDIRGMKKVPRIPVYSWLWDNKLAVGGVATAAAGGYMLYEGMSNIANDSGKLLYFTDIENKVGRTALKIAEPVAGAAAVLGGTEMFSIANGWKFRPFSYIFGSKPVQVTGSIASGMASVIGAGDGIRRVYTKNDGFWNDMLGAAETFGGGYGLVGSLKWMGRVLNVKGLSSINIASWHTVPSRITTGTGMITAGVGAAKYAVNDTLKDGLGGWSSTMGTLGALLVAWGIDKYFNEKLFSEKVFKGIGGTGAAIAAAGFGVDAYNNFSNGKYLNGAGDVAMGVVGTGIAAGSAGDLLGITALQTLNKKIIHNTGKVFEFAVDHPGATIGGLVAAAAIGGSIWYVKRSKEEAKQAPETAPEKPLQPVTPLQN